MLHLDLRKVQFAKKIPPQRLKPGMIRHALCRQAQGRLSKGRSRTTSHGFASSFFGLLSLKPVTLRGSTVSYNTQAARDLRYSCGSEILDEIRIHHR